MANDSSCSACSSLSLKKKETCLKFSTKPFHQIIVKAKCKFMYPGLCTADPLKLMFSYYLYLYNMSCTFKDFRYSVIPPVWSNLVRKTKENHM